MKARAVVLLAAVLAAGCGEGSSPSSGPMASCTTPPVAERQATSALAMTLDPNPVHAGTSAILEVDDASLPAEAMVGLGLAWQCWNGVEWMDTHQLVRGIDPFVAQAIPVEPGATTTIAALGVPVPSTAAILIPQVPPGIYRIQDRVVQSGPQFTPVHLIVEVLEPGAPLPPQLNPIQKADLAARALADVCSRLCGGRTVYLRDQILTVFTPSDTAPDMPAEVRAAIEDRLGEARFVTSEEAAALMDQEAGFDGGNGILLFVGPVGRLTAAGDVVGVDVGTITAPLAGWGGTVQFRWTGDAWELTGPEDTGVTVTSWVS
jgi:hypothetical protein